MDLKSKGIAWVGNIYQRIETMCHDVDNIVNQDAVKYVENQVQIVGESMKKICSDVVQIVDPVRCEAQAVALKGNAAVGTYIKSIIGTKEDHGRVVPMRQPYLEPSDFASRNAFDGLNLAYQSTVPTPGESPQGEEFDLAGNIGVISTNENCDLSMDGNAKEKCSAPEALDLTASLEDTDALQSQELIDNDNENENSCFSVDEDASTSVNGQDSLPSQEVEIVYCVPADVSDSVPNISTAVGLSEMAFSVESSCGSIFTESCTLPRSSLNDVLAEIESYGDAVNEAAHVSEYSGSLISSASPPVVSSNKEEEGRGLTFSNSVLSVESTDRLVSFLSPASTPIDYCNKGEVETGLSCSSNSVMSLESTACSSCSTYVLDCAVDSGMETIDLFDKLKLEESCVIVDNSMLYDVVRRIQRQKSYKKKFQDVFNTRKRVSKEYEQLAIWYGELDTESSQDTVEQPLPFSNAVTLDPDILHSLDSEWELL